MELTIGQLRRIATGPTSDSNMQSIIAGLQAYGVRAGLDRPHRLAMYVAQIAEESGDFRFDHELWGKTPTPAQARYDTRTDLGNTPQADGDGYLYRGRTGIQGTGKTFYEHFRDWCRSQGFQCPDFVANPEAIDTDPWEGLAPIWFWLSKGLNAYADTGNFDMVTQRINGGQNGADVRRAFYTRTSLVLLGFGPTDIKAFQISAGLVADGSAGPVTLAAFHQKLLELAPAQPLIIKPVPAAFIQPAPVPVTNAGVKAALKDAGSRTITFADMQNKIYAGGAASVTGLGIVSQLSDALKAVPPLAWVGVALLVIVALYLLTHQIVLARIEDALSGANTGRDIGLVTPVLPSGDELQPETPAPAVIETPAVATAVT